MNKKRSAILSGWITLCVLCALYISGGPEANLPEGDQLRAASVSAIRYLPVYSYLTRAEAYNSYAVDTAHGSEGYIALTAKSSEPIKLKLISPGGVERIYNVPSTGEVAYYPLSDGNGLYSVQLLRRTEGADGSDLYSRVLLESCEAALPDEFQPYMRPSTYVWFTGYSECVREAARLCAGESDDNVKADLIGRYVCDKLRYDSSLSYREDQGFIRDPDAILARGTGTCLDYAVLSAAMLRSQGIPTKVVYGEARQATGSSHAWNMVYSSSRGWFRLDTTFADQGADPLFVAEDKNYTDLGWY